MNLRINGAERAFPATTHTVADVVAALGYTGKRIAVEQNGEIVPKSQYATTPVQAADVFEIVVAVGGG